MRQDETELDAAGYGDLERTNFAVIDHGSYLSGCTFDFEMMQPEPPYVLRRRS